MKVSVLCLDEREERKGGLTVLEVLGGRNRVAESLSTTNFQAEIPGRE